MKITYKVNVYNTTYDSDECKRLMDIFTKSDIIDDFRMRIYKRDSYLFDFTIPRFNIIDFRWLFMNTENTTEDDEVYLIIDMIDVGDDFPQVAQQLLQLIGESKSTKHLEVVHTGKQTNIQCLLWITHESLKKLLHVEEDGGDEYRASD